MNNSQPFVHGPQASTDVICEGLAKSCALESGKKRNNLDLVPNKGTGSPKTIVTDGSRNTQVHDEPESTTLEPLATKKQRQESTQKPATLKFNRRYPTASGLPPECQLRDAQWLKFNCPDCHWAPDLAELEYLAPRMVIRLSVISTKNSSVCENLWVVVVRLVRRNSPDGVPPKNKVVALGKGCHGLKKFDFPRGSQIIFLLTHVFDVHVDYRDALYERKVAAEIERQAQDSASVGTETTSINESISCPSGLDV